MLSSPQLTSKKAIKPRPHNCKGYPAQTSQVKRLSSPASQVKRLSSPHLAGQPFFSGSSEHGCPAFLRLFHTEDCSGMWAAVLYSTKKPWKHQKKSFIVNILFVLFFAVRICLKGITASFFPSDFHPSKRPNFSRAFFNSSQPTPRYDLQEGLQQPVSSSDLITDLWNT